MKRRQLVLSTVPLLLGGGCVGRGPAEPATRTPAPTMSEPPTQSTPKPPEARRTPTETPTHRPLDTAVPGRLVENAVDGLRVEAQFAEPKAELFHVRLRIRNTREVTLRNVLGTAHLFDGDEQFDRTSGSVPVLDGETGTNLDFLYTREPERVTFYEVRIEIGE